MTEIQLLMKHPSPNTKPLVLGRHILVDLYGCNSEKLNDLPLLESTLTQAVQLANATLVNTQFHQFSPHGVTGIALIEESHFSIHTWPEHQYAAIDLFTCSDRMKTKEAIALIALAVESQRQEQKDISRGTIHPT